MRSSEETCQKLAEVVLHIRRGQATSRRLLADFMNLSPTTAGFYVDHLIETGLLRESGLERGKMGRPKRTLSTVAEAGWFAGVEFNADRIQMAQVAFSGDVLRTETVGLSREANASQVMTHIGTLLANASRHSNKPLLGIGIGAPGVVDPIQGLALDYAFIPQWHNIPIKQRLEKRFKVPVTVENNLRTIALAERWFGAGRQMDDYVILGPRSGFGIAIITRGQLLRGHHYAAGEVGRWPWPQAQQTGQVHDSLTAPAVWRRLSGVEPGTRQPTDLRQAFQSLDAKASPAWLAVIADYAQVIGQLHFILDAEAYFLHGPLTALGVPFCQAISYQICHVMPALKTTPPRVMPSDLGDEAGALGSASLAMESWKPNTHSARIGD